MQYSTDLEYLLLNPSTDYAVLYASLPASLGAKTKHDLIIQRSKRVPVNNVPTITMQEFVELCQQYLDMDVILTDSVDSNTLLGILLTVRDLYGVDLYSSPEDLCMVTPMVRTAITSSMAESVSTIPSSIRTSIQQRRDLFLKHMNNTKINPNTLQHIITTELDDRDVELLSGMAGLSKEKDKKSALYQYVLDNPISTTAEVILGTYGVKGYKDIKLESLISEGIYPKLTGNFISIIENKVYYNLHGQYYVKEL